MRNLVIILLLFPLKSNAQSEWMVSCLSSVKFYDAVQTGSNNVGFNTAYQPLVISHVRSRLIYEFALSAEFYDVRYSKLYDFITSQGFDRITPNKYSWMAASRIAPSLAFKYSIIKSEKVCFFGGIGFAVSRNYYNDMQITAIRKGLIDDYYVNEVYTSTLNKNKFTKSYTLVSGLLINLEKSGKYVLSIESGIGYLQLGKLELNMQKIEDSNQIERPDVPITFNLPRQTMLGGAIGVKYRFNQKEA